MYPHHNIKEDAKIRDMTAYPQAKKKKKQQKMSDIQEYMVNMKLVVLNLVKS